MEIYEKLPSRLELIPDFIAREVDILPFAKLLEYYGLSEQYEARALDTRGFRADFFDELAFAGEIWQYE